MEERSTRHPSLPNSLDEGKRQRRTYDTVRFALVLSSAIAGFVALTWKDAGGGAQDRFSVELAATSESGRGGRAALTSAGGGHSGPPRNGTKLQDWIMKQELRVVAGLSHKNKFLKEAEQAEAHEIEVDKRIEILKQRKNRLAHEVQLEESAAQESAELEAEKLANEGKKAARSPSPPAHKAKEAGGGSAGGGKPRESMESRVQKEIEAVLRASDKPKRERAKGADAAAKGGDGTNEDKDKAAAAVHHHTAAKARAVHAAAARAPGRARSEAQGKAPSLAQKQLAVARQLAQASRTPAVPALQKAARASMPVASAKP